VDVRAVFSFFHDPSLIAFPELRHSLFERELFEEEMSFVLLPNASFFLLVI
jgi:hypothetical protein